MQYEIIQGDCIDGMRTIPEGSVDTCVTSPPYFGLRDYGHDGQIGLERTPEEFVAKLVDVFREVRRVLRDDGTLWLNLGDSYAQGVTGGSSMKSSLGYGGRVDHPNRSKLKQTAMNSAAIARRPTEGLKPKDLIGIPWRVAFALQADGWYLRQDIIWHKPNPMPESVTDRCTKAHEYIFLLSKSARYYFDAQAIAEQATGKPPGNKEATKAGREHEAGDDRLRTSANLHHIQAHETRNRRSVWTVTTKPYKEAHFATFPPDLIRPCILAGCPVDGTVLDPFGGSGTTAQVAIEEGRNAILCELNEEYINLAHKRISGTQLKIH